MLNLHLTRIQEIHKITVNQLNDKCLVDTSPEDFMSDKHLDKRVFMNIHYAPNERNIFFRKDDDEDV